MSDVKLHTDLIGLFLNRLRGELCAMIHRHRHSVPNYLSRVNVPAAGAYFPADAMAGEEAASRFQVLSEGHAFCRCFTERTLGNRSVSRVEWPRWLGHIGACNGLPYLRVAGLASARSGRSKTADSALEKTHLRLLRLKGWIRVPSSP
jgi:hypothetical protein